MLPDLQRSFLGNSIAINQLRILVPVVAGTDAGVLIRGEAGTGREHLARLIHDNGLRAGKPFAVVGCPGYPWSEEFDELFGGQGRPGLLKTCEQGTIYLSSVDELPLMIQGKLARFVENSIHEKMPCPRLIASAKNNLRRLVSQGGFRRDLYYRLTVITLCLPPLRERRQDIPILANYFLESCARMLDKKIVGISKEALEILVNYRWNGNLVELAAAMERAAVVEPSELLTVESLPPSLATRVKLAAAS